MKCAIVEELKINVSFTQAKYEDYLNLLGHQKRREVRKEKRKTSGKLIPPDKQLLT